MDDTAAGVRDEPFLEFSLLRFGNFLLRHRRLVLGLPVALALVTVVATLLWPRSYTSEARFMPQTDVAASGLAGLASQFGFTLPISEPGHSIEFYAQLVTARSILRPTVLSSYALPGETAPEAAEGAPEAGETAPEAAEGAPEAGEGALDAGDDTTEPRDDETTAEQGTPTLEERAAATAPGDFRTLVEIFEVEAPTREKRIEEAMAELEDRLFVSADPETGTVSYAFEGRSPDLAVQVTQQILDLVNEFNVSTRRTQAAAEAEFTSDQLERAEEELRAAENALARFVQQNRRYENSPDLVLEHDRLERQVEMRQQVFMTLAGLYEQAKIEEVRSTPVITVVEPPDFPAGPDPRRLILKTFFAALLGVVLAILIAAVREFGRRAREQDPVAYTNFQALRRQATDDVRRLGRRMRRQAG